MNATCCVPIKNLSSGDHPEEICKLADPSLGYFNDNFFQMDSSS